MKNWFKTLWLTSKEREALKRAELGNLNDESPSPKFEPDIQSRPYTKLIYSNGNITVIFEDGDVISKSDANLTLYEAVKRADSRSEIENMMIIRENLSSSRSKELETTEERIVVSSNLGILSNHPDFTLHGDIVYMKGVNLAMPAVVVASFIEILEKLRAGVYNSTELKDSYIALKMFWLKLALNPLPQSRGDLLVFVKKNNVRITRNGNLVLYRRIVSKEGTDKKFVAFISQNYYLIKRNGQDPRNFGVARDGEEYVLVDLVNYSPSDDLYEEPFCNLQQAYLDLPTYESNDFTSWYGKEANIRLGAVYKISDDEINLNNSICAAGGLHAASVDYDYSGFGDTPVVVLVNPSKAITVPLGETGKMRTTEMFVACVNDKPHGTHFDENGLVAFDNEYHDHTLEELEIVAKNKNFSTISVQEEVPPVSLVDINKIMEMLEERVVQI